MKAIVVWFRSLLLTSLLSLSACRKATTTPTPHLKIGVVIDAGSEKDKSFNVIANPQITGAK